MNLAALVNDKLIRQKVGAPLVGCRKVRILDGVKHVKENLLLSRREMRRRLVEHSAKDLSDVVVASVHLELEQGPSDGAHRTVGRVEAVLGEKVGHFENVLNVNAGLLLVLNLLHIGSEMGLADVLAKERVFLWLSVLTECHSSRKALRAHLDREVSRILHRNVADVTCVVACQVAAALRCRLGPSALAKLHLELVDDLL